MQNKHFNTTITISPNSKRKTFSCSLAIILFNHLYLLDLLKYVSVFPHLGIFPASLVILMSSLLPASWLEISNVILNLVFRHEIRRQMSVYFESYETVILWLNLVLASLTAVSCPKTLEVSSRRLDK